MRTSFARRVVLSLLISAALIGSNLQPIMATTILAQNRSDPGSPDRPTDPEVQISGPTVDASLERAPDPDKAVVIDQANPDWRTVYGTEAGRQLLPPRRSEVPAAIEGAAPPLTGFWSTQTIQAGTQGVTAVAYAPDGRLFAGLSGLGLHVYSPTASSLYQWTSITATPGGLVSNNVTALAVFGSQLWIGTGGSGISVYSLSSGTWITYTVANSPLPSNTINRITPVINPNDTDYVWISTSGGGAAKFTPGRPNIWNIINSADSGLIGNTMYDVAVDLNGATTTTWFASNAGLTSWNGTTFSSEGGSPCTPFSFVTRVIVDKRHRVWYTPVNIIPAKPQDANSPTAGVDSPIGVCLRTNGFFPLFLPTYTLYNTTSPGLPNNDVTDLSEDFAGRIWMSMQGAGGGAVNDNTTWKFYTSPTSPLVNNDVRRVLAVGEAVWWGHGGANALTVHSPNWLRLNNVPSGETPQAIFNETTRTWVGGTSKIAYSTGGTFTTTAIPGNTSYVTSFASDANNHLWIGTSGGGVYDYDNTNFTPYTTTSGLPNNGVNALLSDQLGRIWAGTNNGLAMRAEAGYWLSFTTSTSPIAGNIIEALARDSADRLWIGTATGLSVYNPAGGNNAWISYTIANGLPANQVTGLTSDSSGNMWVSTYGGGVAVSNSISSTWTVYSTTAYVPSTQALDITSDPSGRIWTTTAGGLVVRQGSTWRTFHAPETALDSHRLGDVVADADRTWVKANTSIAVRGVLTSPIGNVVPAISSFSPISATPGAIVIINGSAFDDRGPEFNVVKFPDSNHFPTLPAEVISATTTSLAVKVPALVSSGKLQVEANGLKSPLSTVSFQLMPKITSLSATCVSVGSELKISGLGFLDGSAAAYVKIGSGAERITDATDPTQLRTFIRPGDTSGQVRVRLLNNNQVIASQSLSLGTINVSQTKVQQAVEGEQLVWGKRTLVQLAAISSGCGGAQITRASLKWKFAGGLTMSGGTVNYPNGKTLPTSVPSFSLDNTVTLIAPLDLSDVAWNLDNLGLPYFSTLQYFDSVDVVLRNNNVDALTINLPKSKFNFVDTANVRRHIITMMVTGDTPAEQDANYDQTMYTNFAAVARMYPQQDAWPTGGRYSWLHSTPIWFSYPDKIKIGGDNSNHEDVRDEVDDYLDPDGNTWAVAYIDQNNIASGSGGGIGSPSWHTVVAINKTDAGGRYIAHEVMHAFGFVDDDAPNYQPSDVSGEDNHSKYNEGRWDRDGYSFSDCSIYRTFRQALDDATGNPTRRVVRLISGDVPKELTTSACSVKAGQVQSNTAKSIISYAPNRNNFNTVLEPYDYRNLLDQLCGGGGCWGYSGLAAAQAPIGLRAPSVTNDVTRTLHLSGLIDVTGTVTTSLSYVAVDDGAVTPQTPNGTHHLLIRAADNTILHDQVFALEESALAPHDGSHPDQANHGTNPISLFNLRVPFPDNAAQAEIVHDNVVLWSKSVSANAPTINLTAPNGGSFNAGTPITVTWTANDLNGDPLQFALDYSSDNGATWLKINPKISGTSYLWTPGYVTATTTAKVRVRASDGFNTTFATSNPFVLTAKAPTAIILAPDNGATLAEGEVIDLQGASLTSSGENAGAFTWKINNVTVGNTRTITTPVTAIGVNTITLQVDANALSGSRSITVTVIPDYDRDRLPNSWEQQYQLNPLDASDANTDVDGDGLSNLDEYRLGTNPRSADTDADGVSDSTEINAGTDPLNPASKPIATPILNVGSVSMGFTVNSYSLLPGAKSTWVTNLGGGTLNFNVAKDAAWLTVSPVSGAAPQQLNVNTNFTGLALGTYTGHITVTAPGVAASPQVITVTLNYESIPNLKYVYLPLVLK